MEKNWVVVDPETFFDALLRHRIYAREPTIDLLEFVAVEGGKVIGTIDYRTPKRYLLLSSIMSAKEEPIRDGVTPHWAFLTEAARLGYAIEIYGRRVGSNAIYTTSYFVC